MHRPQFNLKRLLAALTFCCICLGAWNLYSAIFNPFVGGEHTITGGAIRIRGRLFDSSGRKCETFFVCIEKPANRGGDDIYQKRGIQVNREWPGFYYLDLEMPPVEEPGEYSIIVNQLPDVAGYKGAVHGRLTVFSKEQNASR